MSLPLKEPYLPMEAESAKDIPRGPEWQYEPKWDGFRCIAFRDGEQCDLQSKAGQPLARYFPELVAGLLELEPKKFVLDGEIVIPEGGNISFDELLMRIHPAESRIRKLSREHPSMLIVFDLLVDEHGKSLVSNSLAERRKKLERFASEHFNGSKSVALSPATRDLNEAKQWFKTMGGGLDGVVAKNTELPYLSGERAMLKIKNMRTADCVVGGFRYGTKSKLVGSLLLGLYDQEGRRQSRSNQETRGAGRTSWLHRPRARRPQPLEHGTLHRMGTARAQARLRSPIRSLQRRPLPPRHKIPPLAPRQSRAAVYEAPGGKRKQISARPVELLISRLPTLRYPANLRDTIASKPRKD